MGRAWQNIPRLEAETKQIQYGAFMFSKQKKNKKQNKKKKKTHQKGRI